MQLGHLRAADSESAAYSQHCCWQTDKVEQMTSVLQTPHWLGCVTEQNISMLVLDLNH